MVLEIINIKNLKYYNELFICAYCAYCVNNSAACPTYLSAEHEIVTGRGKMITARNIALGNLKKREGLNALKDGLFQCTFCKACEDNCIVNIPLTKVYSELKSLIQDQLPKNTQRMFENLENKKNFYGLEQEDRANWSFDIEEIYDEWVNSYHHTGFFLGCVYSYSGRAGSGPVSLLKLAKKANEKISVFSPTEYCCGNPYLLGGERNKAKELAIHNVEQIKNLGIKNLIISCAGCYRVFTSVYPALIGKEIPFKVISHMEYLSQLIREKKLNFPNKTSVKVTFKDPCELGRHCGVYDVAREVITSLPGVENREMLNHKENALCCGAGGLLKANYPVMASDIAKRLISQMEEQTVDFCLNACPSCLLNIDENLRLADSKIKSIDISELVLDRTKN
ncbi:MAG: (Fe-S)-binding protein [Candidatus Hodarchaeales archaeon]